MAAAIVGAVALYLIDEGLRDPRAVKAVLVNIFGGITRCDEVANGIAGDPDTLYRLTTAPWGLHRYIGSGLALQPVGVSRRIVGAAIAGTATLTGAQVAKGGLVFSGVTFRFGQKTRVHQGKAPNALRR